MTLVIILTFFLIYQNSIDITVNDVYICIYTVYISCVYNSKARSKVMITLTNLTKKLDKFTLRDINLSIPNGYICGLVGENGAGKTTLLNTLLGLYKVNEGTIQIDDMDYEKSEKQIKNKFGVVLVDELFDSSISVISNANYYGAYYPQYSSQKFLQLLEDYNISPKKKFKKLSKGEKLKCQFAFALAHNPEILILDEPTANFDPDFREKFFETIREFVSDGKKTVILATHITDDLDKLADYLIYLEKGELVFAGDIEEFRDTYRIAEGEKYKINLIREDRIINIEESAYTTKALIKPGKRDTYDDSLTISRPTIEEFMYLYSKRKGRRK